MVAGIQIVGIIFGLLMLYLTFLYYKRSSYSTKSFVMWMIIWAMFLITTFWPQTLYTLMQHLNIERTVDLFVIGGFMFFAVITFYLFITIKGLERTIETLVRKVALDNASKEGKSKETQKKVSKK